MPVSCVPDDLAEPIKCLSKQSNTHDLLAQIVYLLCRINGMTECNPNALAPNIKCLSKWTEEDLLASAVFLLCTIANAVEGGGGITINNVNIKTYTNDPNIEGVVPDNPLLPAIAYKAGTEGPTLDWDPDSGLWY